MTWVEVGFWGLAGLRASLPATLCAAPGRGGRRGARRAPAAGTLPSQGGKGEPGRPRLAPAAPRWAIRRSPALGAR